jgi:AcrR family transcriptional regulator
MCQQPTELLFGMARKRLPAGERRIRILDAAVEVFAESGYAGAKMQDIAARAGVVPSVLYDHFGSKRELHITLLELHAQQMRERSLRRLEGASVEELVRASVATYFEFVEDDPFIWRFLHRDPPADPEIADVCRELADQGTEHIAGLIRFGAGDVKPVKGITLDEAAWILARATQSATHGVATWWYENRDVPRERVVELVFMLLWQGFDGMLKQASAG